MPPSKSKKKQPVDKIISVVSGWGTDTEPPPSKRLVREWNVHQLAIFADVATGKDNLVVIARAGSGKTTTIVEAVYRVPPKLSILVAAFNKSIRDTLVPLVPASTDTSTFHSLGMRTILLSNPKAKFEQWKLSKVVEEIIGNIWVQKDLADQLQKCASLAKGHMIDQVGDLDEIIDKYGIDAGSGKERDDFITYVCRILSRCRAQSNIFDYDDMIWLPLVLGLHVPKYDRVFVDETQDLNKAQIQLVLKAVKPEGKVVAVGDDRQAIYGFRGADDKAIPSVIETLNAKILPLSVTYRCAKSIVRLANKLVPDLEHAPLAVEGSVTDVAYDEMKKNARPGDFVLSRVNAPLIGLAMSFLKDNRPANIQGRDIGGNLSGMIKRSKAKTVKDFEKYVMTWRAEEVARLVQKKRDTTSAEDKAECLMTLCEGAVTLADVKAKIDRLFSDTDDKNKIILSTTHKAKGLERERVFVLANTYRKGKSTEEDNLWYVAITRAKSELFIVRK